MATHEIKLELSDIRELFRPSESNDPFLPSYRALPGIEQVALYLKANKRHDDIKVVVTLLKKPDMPDHPKERLHDALTRYCDARTDENLAEMHFHRRKAIRDFQRGLLIAAVCLAVAALFAGQTVLLKSLGDFLSTTFTIFGSVALWHPAEALLFDQYIYGYQARIYQKIKDLPFDVQFKT